MKKLLVLGLLLSLIVSPVNAQEQRVTAKIKKQNTEHNTAIDGSATKPAATAAKTTAKPAPIAKDPIGDVASAEKVVVYQVNVLKQAKARVAQAAKARDALHAAYKGKGLDKATYAAVMKRYEAADQEIAASEKALTTARGAFDILFEKYQKLGGTTDYRAQVSP